MIDWYILEKSLTGSLSEAEQEQLDIWLKQSYAHRQLYAKIRAQKEYAPTSMQYKEWREHYAGKLVRLSKYSWKYRILKIGSVAAVLLFFAGGLYWFDKSREPLDFPTLAYPTPDRTNVRLITAGGETIPLSALAREDTLIIDGITIAKEQQKLAYITPKDSFPTMIVPPRNSIVVPRGAEFQLTLSDSTQVWLNSDSKIDFPVNFIGSCREITLYGEAYFKVSSDKEKPFIVHCNGMSVSVLGTEFNVNTRDSTKMRTTLVSGKVKVALDPYEAIVLKPGEMSEANSITGQINSRSVKVRKYIAWQQGEYFFEDASMDEILQELALWYDITFEYKDERVKQEKFSGCLLREESIVSLLNKIEQTTYVHFIIRQNQVIVNYGNK